MPFAQTEIAKVFVKIRGSIESREIVSNVQIHMDLEVPEWCLPTMSPNALTTLPHPDPGLLYHFLFWTFDGHPNPGDPGAPGLPCGPVAPCDPISPWLPLHALTARATNNTASAKVPSFGLRRTRELI